MHQLSSIPAEFSLKLPESYLIGQVECNPEAYLECHRAQVIFPVVEILDRGPVFVAVRFQQKPFDDATLAHSRASQNDQPNALHVTHFHFLSLVTRVTKGWVFNRPPSQLLSLSLYVCLFTHEPFHRITLESLNRG